MQSCQSKWCLLCGAPVKLAFGDGLENHQFMVTLGMRLSGWWFHPSEKYESKSMEKNDIPYMKWK